MLRPFPNQIHYLIIFILFFLLLPPLSSSLPSDKINYVFVTADLNTESDIFGYKLYYFSSSPPDTLSIFLPSFPFFCFSDSLLYNVHYTFFMTALDSSLNESLPSISVPFFLHLDTLPPKPPSRLQLFTF